jgi:hypothetical protein
MIELQRNFLSGVMNKDLDPHFLPDGAYRDALNIIVGDSDGAFVSEEGSHNGVAQNYLGNVLKGGNLGLTNAMCIGSLAYETNNSIYWLVASDNLDAIYEYNETTNTLTPVIRATKTSTTVSKLGFNKKFFVTGINYINGLLFWTDNLNPPRRINIDRAKNYAVDGFTEADINVILAPPLSAPTINLYSQGEANNLENKFLYFSYRYKYLDNEYSALAPFSPVAFFPKEYAYDYGVSENISMVNNFNTADITFNSGSKNVKEIQLVFRDTQSTNTYVIDSLVKELNNYDDNTDYVFTFKNNKVFTLLPIEQVNRLFDNVPIRAKSQELIGSRLVYGNYTQFFDLLKENKEPINPAFSVSLLSESITSGTPTPTFKSNRDYEIGIVYLDDYGRTTTVITPTDNTNTIYIPASNAIDANNIRVTIDGTYQPPAFATNYRFMIKQDKQEYYNVFPLTYFEDGQFKWFLINQADQDKISVGSYLYLKGATNNTNTQYKVLDIQSKNANFLNSADSNQPAGVYFRLKIESTILPPITYFYDYNVGGGVNPPSTLVSNRFNVAEDAIFYGIGVDDMITGASNAYTGTNDARFYVEIDSTGGSADTFKYYVSYNANYKLLVASGIAINSAADQTLTYSGSTCSIRFLSSTGHTTKDYWVVNCRGNLENVCLNIFGGAIDYSTPVPGVFFTLDNWSPSPANNQDRPIKAGAILTFKYKETNGTDQWITQTFISTKDYVNIEEWFIEDGAYQKWVALDENDQSVGPKNVCFRRGVLVSTGRPGLISQGSTIAPTTLSYPVYMYFYSFQGGVEPAIDTKFSLQQSDFPSLFETVPTDTNQDIYYELSQTYPIINGNHYGNVDNQNIALGAPAIIDLNTFDFNSDFNAFSFGNGVESFRIRDDWNSATMQFSPRANSTIEGYEQQTLVQALTYSGIYTQTSAINRLNEFNLSLGNFKYLDRFFGSIQKLFSRDTDLVVFQENKISKVLYGKNLLSDSTGGGVVASIPEVLGTQISYEGEYGISLNPESFTRWGNDLFFTDARRGAVMALQPNGLFEISSQGMKNWFKANLDTNTVKLGMMDPYFEHYVLAIDNDRQIKTCAISVAPTSLSFNGTTQKKSFYIQSNTDWSVTVPTNSWLTVSDKFGSNNQLIYVEVVENLGSPRNLNITVSGCSGNITIPVTQATKPVVYDWYQLLNCTTLATAYSEQHAENAFDINERVTSDGATYTITNILHTAPVGTLLPIVTTGLTGCPGPTYDWYALYKCSDGSTANSQSYAIGTFAVNDRVESGGSTYTVTSVLTSSPGGTLLSITDTGLTGCPTLTTYYELSECSPGTGYAYTTINPGSVGRRFVLPYPTEKFYTYTGATLVQSSPPPLYNGSIQITSFYSCP